MSDLARQKRDATFQAMAFCNSLTDAVAKMYQDLWQGSVNFYCKKYNTNAFIVRKRKMYMHGVALPHTLRGADGKKQIANNPHLSAEDEEDLAMLERKYVDIGKRDIERIRNLCAEIQINASSHMEVETIIPESIMNLTEETFQPYPNPRGWKRNSKIDLILKNKQLFDRLDTIIGLSQLEGMSWH